MFQNFPFWIEKKRTSLSRNILIENKRLRRSRDACALTRFGKLDVMDGCRFKCSFKLSAELLAFEESKNVNSENVKESKRL